MAGVRDALPATFAEFQAAYPTEQACADYLEKLRWPGEFVCPKCGTSAAPWHLGKPGVLKCSMCRADLSLMADSVMRGSHTELTTWFGGAYILVAQAPTPSVRQFQRKLGIKRYETAYALLQKLRAPMLQPEKERIGGDCSVDIGAVVVTTRWKRPSVQEVCVLGALETSPPGRLRLQAVEERDVVTCVRFAQEHVAPLSAVRTDGWSGYSGMKKSGYVHAVMSDAALLLPKGVSDLQSWLDSSRRGRSVPLPNSLNEYVFRFNGRGRQMASFNRVLGLGAPPLPPAEITSNEAGGA